MDNHWYTGVAGDRFRPIFSPNMNAIMSSVDKRYYGIASSTSGTMRLVGQAVSIAATLIIELCRAAPSLLPLWRIPCLKSAKVAFVVFAITCVGGVFASLARGNMNREAKLAEE